MTPGRNRFAIGNVSFHLCLYAAMVFIGAVMLYPFVNILALSLNDSVDSIRGGVYLFPRVFTLNNYVTIFAFGNLFDAFKISIVRTVVGTVTSVACTSLLAYTLSRRDFFARRFFSLLFVLTMYVSGGLIPGYLLIRNLGLINNFWVYIIPGLIGVWNAFVVRSYIDGLPESLQESARIDGANDLLIFFRIIFPLCMPVIATISLFVAVGQWNAWIDTYLYAGGAQQLSTLQYELMKIIRNSDAAVSMAMVKSMNNPALQSQLARVSPESVKMAITITATLPILLIYPFVQKYFVKGLTLGAVKQ
jgi:putative aldouronate transport system permease protein